MTALETQTRLGAEARVAGLEHNDNPHLATIRRCAEAGEDAGPLVGLAEAWWDGWEAEDRRVKTR